MKSHLKVKVVSLSAEMTYIRRQERKWKKRAKFARQKQKSLEQINYSLDNFWSQRQHRNYLKAVARVAHLAYGCMRGVPYGAMENICYGQWKGYGSSEPNWDEIMATVERFSKDEPTKTEIMQHAEQWLTDAKVWYEGNVQRINTMNSTKELLSEEAQEDLDYLESFFQWKKIAEVNGRSGLRIPTKPKYVGIR